MDGPWLPGLATNLMSSPQPRVSYYMISYNIIAQPSSLCSIAYTLTTTSPSRIISPDLENRGIGEAPQSRPGRLEVANQVNSGLGKDRPRSQSNLPASILLVDDFEPWRRSVRSSLEPHQQLQIVGEARRIRSRPKGPGVEAGPDFAGYRSPQPERNRSRKSDR